MASPRAERAVDVCLAEDTLSAFADGQLGPSEIARMDAHLGGCAACGALVAHVLTTGGALASAEASRSLAPAERAPTLEPGTRVGRYVVLEQVGVGAMSTVYAAQDPELDRRVALKLLRADARGDDLRARLYREAKAMARLAHPNVITVHDVGAYGSQLFVAMELVTGGTLRGWLARAPRGWRAILETFAQAGRGLACAHAAGLVHRDFKPDNVLVSEDGRVRVTDFGLVRASQDEAPEVDAATPLAADLVTTITRTGALVGTPAYMAPEQLRGEATDARSDMFGFCVALYEALYEERPFEGRNVGRLRSTTASGVVRPTPRGSDVPDGVRDALLVGLRPRPADRYASMDALLDALAAATPAGDPAPARAPARRASAARRWAAGLAMATATLGLVGGLAMRGSEPTLATTEPPPPVDREATTPVRLALSREALPPSPSAAGGSPALRRSSRADPAPAAATPSAVAASIRAASEAPPSPAMVAPTASVAPSALPTAASSAENLATSERE
jgi:tRNA A-37 threonylcarbamoyl transferase component Bud32